MKKVVLGVVVLLAAQVALASALKYEFHQTTNSDIENLPSTDCSGRAVIDGERSRVEFLTGNAYSPGTFVITTNGSRNLTFVDPNKKSYVEINAASVSAALGSTQITIANKKIDVTQMPDHPVIAGIPTDHYRLNISYDITVLFGTIPMTQSVTTLIDRWVTMAFGDVGGVFLSSGALHTGNSDLDDLVTAENTKTKGFALKETQAVTTTSNRPARPGSQLSEFRQTRTQTRELTVTSIEATAVADAGIFKVPEHYRRAGPINDDTKKTPVSVLSMEPPTGH